jgi:hypothetical protein
MGKMRVRLVSWLGLALIVLCCASCRKGKSFYPVRGQVFADGKPAQGVTVIFHPEDEADPDPVQPSAVVAADGSYVLRSYVVQERKLREGAPAGRYRVTCTWYPPDLQNYLGNENLPDKLQGKYANAKTSSLRAEIPEQATEVPPFRLEIPKR